MIILATASRTMTQTKHLANNFCEISSIPTVVYHKLTVTHFPLPYNPTNSCAIILIFTLEDSIIGKTVAIITPPFANQPPTSST